MYSLKKTTFIAVSILLLQADLSAQTNSFKKNFIFSAIAGHSSKSDSTLLPSTAKSVEQVNGDKSIFKIVLTKAKKLVIYFEPSSDVIGLNRAKLLVKNATGKSIGEINLTGLCTKGLEGENEPPLTQVVDALGYKVNIGWTSLANHARPELQGDEIAASLFRKAGTGKVEITPVARYSPDFELPFGYYNKTADSLQPHRVGILAKQTIFPEHQTLFPQLASGSRYFDPGTTTFGFYADGAGHSAYSEDEWNILLYPGKATHATRIYPLKDKMGKLIQHSYLLCFEEAANGDYNDYVFIVKNITPADAAFVQLFNGKNLDGWNTFLSKQGKDKDPNKNFQIENETLHVIGKELGYAITQKGYSDYHFKVDFKWGETRWPPRQDAKRDAGICYNIPVNEPDSIWPQSIECQIQEGDVGDFWLLGFSTIKVGGKQNVPTNHVRMVKQKDAEKPYGEWNTVEIISWKGKCVHIVNGVVVNAGEEASIKEGRILLQSEYAEVYYKNVKLRKL